MFSFIVIVLVYLIDTTKIQKLYDIKKFIYRNMKKMWSEQEIDFIKYLYLKRGLTLTELYPELVPIYRKELRNKRRYYFKLFEAVAVARLLSIEITQGKY